MKSLTIAQLTDRKLLLLLANLFTRMRPATEASPARQEGTSNNKGTLRVAFGARMRENG